MKNIIYRWLGSLFFILLVIAGGCSSSASQDGVKVYISAAASLTDSLQAIKAEYEKRHGNVKLVMNFAGSGTLRLQIENGAPVDLFLSAGRQPVQALVDKKLILEKDRAAFLRNRMTVVVPADADTQLQGVDQLLSKDYGRLAIADPVTAPAGAYAKQILTKMSLWNQLQKKMILAKDVRQVLAYVESRNVDAGFVYKTDAFITDKVKIAWTFPADTGNPIEYWMGIVADTKQRQEAERFYQYLTGKEAQSIFQRYGFEGVTP